MKHLLPVPVLAMLLAGCSGGIDTRISSSGVTGLSPTGFVVSNESAVNAGQAEAERLVIEALGNKGYVQAAGGALNLEVTLSSRPAMLAVGSAAKPDDIAKAKKNGLFGGCKKTEHRLSITLTRISDGVPAYRSVASEYHCQSVIDKLVKPLVESAIADVGQPRGDYVMKRAKG